MKFNPRKFFAPYLLGLFGFLLIVCYTAHQYAKHKTALQGRFTTIDPIDTLISLNLRGIDQWILLRGSDVNAPVLLFLHGGPGAPLFPVARKTGKITGIENHFIVAYWEQPGTGKSHKLNLADGLINLDLIIEDARQITEYLRMRFSKQKIFLFSRSFGSVPGILLIQRYPELFIAYVSSGQFVNTYKNDSLSFEITKQWAIKRQNNQAVEELSALGGPPFTPEELLLQRKWATYFHDLQLHIDHVDYLR